MVEALMGASPVLNGSENTLYRL